MDKKDCVIIGVGNVLRSDDGIGVKVVELLEKESLPGKPLVISGDISGLDLIKYFEYKKVIIIDAVKMGKAPGAVVIFKPEDAVFKGVSGRTSTHGLNLEEAIKLAYAIRQDYNISIIGVEPVNTDYGTDLSKEVEEKLPDIIEKIKEILKIK